LLKDKAPKEMSVVTKDRTIAKIVSVGVFDLSLSTT
jgi:hypothetical protein